MNALRNIQQQFLGYLLDNNNPGIIRHVMSSRNSPATQRMTIYGNAYRSRLLEVLNTDYDRLHAYLGDELFEQLAQQYIDRYPSHHASLRHYGKLMPEFVARVEPFDRLPEVAEIVSIEQAFADSFDAADASCVTHTELAGLKASAWASLELRFQPALRLLPLHYNSFEIWHALSDSDTPPVKAVSDTSWLIWRQEMVSRYRALDSSEAAALDAASNGGSFADVCESLLVYVEEDEVPGTAVGYLRRWIEDQMVCGLVTERETG